MTQNSSRATTGRTRWLIVASLFFSTLATSAAGFEFHSGDRVAIVGGGLADRMQHDGFLETFLQNLYPDHELVFRNLGFTGDEVAHRMRSDGFGSPEEWLDRVEADVVLAFFGYNESYGGKAQLEKFTTDLADWIVSITKPADGRAGRRLAIFSPMAFEQVDSHLLPKGDKHNVNLQLYTRAMRDVATQHGVTFVDLFQPTQKLFQTSDQRFTINGVHLNESGNRHVAEIIVRELVDPNFNSGPGDFRELNEAVRDKNFYWFHRYRVTDGYSTYGGRRVTGGSEWTPTNEPVLKRELEVLDAMTANRDKRIWAQAQEKEEPVDDSNLPELIPVATNKPGPLPGGEYPFLGAREAIGKMTVAKGMQVDLFASEEQFPELKNPVQMAVDTRGRLWVAVWPSYPHWQPDDEMNDKLLILEDTDGDGQADVCKTFAGGLHNPTGFEFYNGGVYVAQVPDLWFLEDTDGDDVADRRTRVLGGIDSADTHHSINSFVLGPGGGLHFAEGLFHRTQVETNHSAPRRVSDGGVFRYEPKTQRLDVYSAYNFPNPHGHVFDYWGMNIVHDGTGAKPIFGPSFSGHVDFPRRHPGAPQVYQQRTRPCSGTAILSSAHFPESNRDTFLVCNVIGFQGILQYKLEADGAGLKGTEIEPIVYSSDVNFRPSDIEIGADGAIYFSDWQNPLIGHLQHNLRDSNRDHRHGRVYRVTQRGRPLVTPAKIAGQPIHALLNLLKERDNGVRYRTRIELSSRDSAEVVAAIPSWVEALDPRDKAHEHHLLEALWVHQHHHEINEPLLRKLLTSDDFRVRAAATLVLRRWRGAVSDHLALIEELVHDDHPRVRLMGVLICSDMGTAAAAELALEAARYPSDKFLKYAINEAVATLAPYIQQALADGRAVAADNPAAVGYLLPRVDVAVVLQHYQDPGFLSAVLAHPSLSVDQRRRALRALASARAQSPVDVLFELIASGQAEYLAEMLAGWPAEELDGRRADLERLAATHDEAELRQSALAALACMTESPQQLWVKFEGGIDLLNSIEKIPEAESRGRFYDLVRQQLAASSAETVGAAVTALAHIPGHDEEKVDDLTSLLTKNRAVPEVLATLAAIPEQGWNASRAQAVLNGVVDHVSALSPTERTTEHVRATIEFAERLAKFVEPAARIKATKAIDRLSVTRFEFGALPHRMAFEREKLFARPGGLVEIEFKNTDNMPHNWVLVRPGGMTEVGMLAEEKARDPDFIARAYVPTSGQVIAATGLVDINKRDKIFFNAPSEPGVYPYLCTYPGHWRRMFGALYVVDDPEACEANPDEYLAANSIEVKDDLLRYNRPATDWSFAQLESSLLRLGDDATFERGKELFRVTNCVACHRLNNEGNEFGPDLAKLDAKRTPAEILVDMLEPSKTINEKFQSHSFMMDTGQTVTGLIADETDSTLLVVEDPLASCDPVELTKDEIEERFKSTVSLMPNGLLDRLTEDEIMELLAYIVARGDANAYQHRSQSE